MAAKIPAVKSKYSLHFFDRNIEHMVFIPQSEKEGDALAS
jgi:hypothetical protein